MNGRKIRLGKLFDNGKNAVVIAMDHGEFDGPIPGMVDLRATAKSIWSGVDGILLSPGGIEHCAEAFGYRGAPLPIVRLNWSTTYCFAWDYDQAATCVAIEPEDAVAAGAEVVVVSLTLKTGSEAQDAANVDVFSKLAVRSRRLGLPVIGEVFPAGHPSPEELHDQVRRGCRIAAELGCDAIKTFYTSSFADVVAGCPIPILALGAEKLPTQLDALGLARREIDGGARGVVFGRNAIQVPNPELFQQALCSVVKEGFAPGKAAELFDIRD